MASVTTGDPRLPDPQGAADRRRADLDCDAADDRHVEDVDQSRRHNQRRRFRRRVAQLHGRRLTCAAAQFYVGRPPPVMGPSIYAGAPLNDHSIESFGGHADYNIHARPRAAGERDPHAIHV